MDESGGGKTKRHVQGLMPCDSALITRIALLHGLLLPMKRAYPFHVSWCDRKAHPLDPPPPHPIRRSLLTARCRGHPRRPPLRRCVRRGRGRRDPSPGRRPRPCTCAWRPRTHAPLARTRTLSSHEPPSQEALPSCCKPQPQWHHCARAREGGGGHKEEKWLVRGSVPMPCSSFPCRNEE